MQGCAEREENRAGQEWEMHIYRVMMQLQFHEKLSKTRKQALTDDDWEDEREM